MENEDNKIIKIINSIMPAAMVLMLLVSMGYLIAGQLVLPNDRGVSSRDCISLDMSFELVRSDGETENISLPITYDKQDEEEVILSTTIAPDMNNEWLMIWNMGHEMEVYIEDELRESVSAEGRRLFRGEVPYQYDFINLYEKDAGKTLKIRFPKFHEENHQLGSVYIGDKASLLLKAIRPYQFSLFLAITIMAMGIMTIFKVRVFAHGDQRSYELFYMSLGVTIASAWFLFNSPAAQFVFPNVETAKDCAFIFASMIPLPFLMYVARLFKGRYSMVFGLLKLASVLSFAVLVVGFLIFGAPLNTLFIPMEISTLIALGLCFAFVTGDIQNRKVKEYFIAAMGLVGFIAFALLYVVLFALYPYRGDSGVVLIAGIICVYSTSVISYRKNQGK